MRTGQTVVVLGAHKNAAQFEPFVWPETCVLRTPFGFVTEPEFRNAARSTGVSNARDLLATSYVLAARGVVTQSDVDAVSSWIAVVEAATRTPCTLCFAHGAVPITAVPFFVARRSLDVLLLCGPGLHGSARVVPHDDTADDHAAARILHAQSLIRDPTVGALRAAYFHIERGTVFELRPRTPCTLCGGSTHGPARYMMCACFESDNPLPDVHVCASCASADTVSFSILGYRFRLSEAAEPEQTSCLRKKKTLVLLASDAPVDMSIDPAVDTVWSAHARIGLAVARAIFRFSEHDAVSGFPMSPFARAMLRTLRDMKLCRLIVERLALSPLSSSTRPASRSLSLLVTVPCASRSRASDPANMPGTV